MNNTISVIMAAYNCEKTVGKAIDSILAQTYTDWVMIVCDDGSTDGTLTILQDYAARYPEKFVVLQNGRNQKAALLPESLPAACADGAGGPHGRRRLVHAGPV